MIADCFIIVLSTLLYSKMIRAFSRPTNGFTIVLCLFFWKNLNTVRSSGGNIRILYSSMFGTRFKSYKLLLIINIVGETQYLIWNRDVLYQYCNCFEGKKFCIIVHCTSSSEKNQMSRFKKYYSTQYYISQYCSYYPVDGSSFIAFVTKWLNIFGKAMVRLSKLNTKSIISLWFHTALYDTGQSTTTKFRSNHEDFPSIIFYVFICSPCGIMKFPNRIPSREH